MTPARQRGITTVEFAVIGSIVFLVLFAVIEVGRAMFVLGALGESTRRAARMAAVCPIDDPAVTSVALFNVPGGGTDARIVAGLTPSNVVLEYLDASGTVLADPAANFTKIHFVRVRIAGFQHRMLIPFAEHLFTTPEFSTTLRRESLGVPRSGTVEPC